MVIFLKPQIFATLNGTSKFPPQIFATLNGTSKFPPRIFVTLNGTSKFPPQSFYHFEFLAPSMGLCIRPFWPKYFCLFNCKHIYYLRKHIYYSSNKRKGKESSFSKKKLFWMLYFLIFWAEICRNKAPRTKNTFW